jgi:hypothetical protein
MASYYFPIQQFLQAFNGLGLANISGTSGNFTFTYIVGTSSANQTVIEDAAAAWDWEAVPNPPPWQKQATGNVAGFVAACWADSNLSPTAKIYIANAALTLLNWQFIPAAVTQYWTYLVASAPAWLDSGTETIILGYALAYGIPLVSQ